MFDYNKTYGRAVLILSYRDHFEKELYSKMIKKGFDKKYVLEVIDELKELRYLDDFRVGLSFVNSLKDKTSIFDMKYKMKNKGVKDEIITRVLQESQVDEKQVAISILKKRLGVKDDDNDYANLDIAYDDLNKSCAYLQRKGFSYSSISYARKFFEV